VLERRKLAVFGASSRNFKLQAEVGQTPELDMPFWTSLVTTFSTEGDQFSLLEEESVSVAVIAELAPETKPVAAKAKVIEKITAAYLFMITS